MNSEVRANGSRFLVVFTDGMGKQGRMFGDYLSERGIPSVHVADLLDPRDPLMHLPDGFHWTPKAHGIIADNMPSILSAHLQSSQ